MGRTPCCEKEGLKKGPWTPEEDQKLTDYIQKHGPGNWRTLPKKAGLQRCGKSCRLRWTNYLRPDIKRGRFSPEEEETIIHLHSILGNKWSAIAAKLPGRTDNEIKNYWNTHIRKKLLRMGIDPVTHGPRLDLLDVPSLLASLQNLNPSLSSSSLLNIPNSMLNANLQTLLNPELLRLATSLSQTPALNPIMNTTFMQNPVQSPVVLPNIQHNPPRNLSLEAKNHAKTEHGFNNGSDFSSLFSTPSLNSLDPMDSTLVNLISSASSEDDIETYFGNMVKKFEPPSTLNICSS